MSVWISDEKLLIFASLISPSKFVKNTPLRVVFFNSLLGVSSGDETLHLMFDILLEHDNSHENERLVQTVQVIPM